MSNPFFLQCDVRNLDPDELEKIAAKVQSTGFVLINNNNLTEQQFTDFMKRFGSCETPGKFMNPAEAPEISIVTGKKQSDGRKIGMFGSGELGWHSNGNSRHLAREILIGLYCVVGDENCTLSLCDTSTPFYDMSAEEQEYWKKIRIRLEFRNNTIYKLDEDDPELEFMSQKSEKSGRRGSIRRLVSRHPHTGRYHFYFPYHFITMAWKGREPIDHHDMIETLRKKIFQSHYQYHFILKENDLLLMDQLVTLHRRTPALPERRLWRVACDYSLVSGIHTSQNQLTDETDMQELNV